MQNKMFAFPNIGNLNQMRDLKRPIMIGMLMLISTCQASQSSDNIEPQPPSTTGSKSSEDVTQRVESLSGAEPDPIDSEQSKVPPSWLPQWARKVGSTAKEYFSGCVQAISSTCEKGADKVRDWVSKCPSCSCVCGCCENTMRYNDCLFLICECCQVCFCWVTKVPRSCSTNCPVDKIMKRICDKIPSCNKQACKVIGKALKMCWLKNKKGFMHFMNCAAQTPDWLYNKAKCTVQWTGIGLTCCCLFPIFCNEHCVDYTTKELCQKLCGNVGEFCDFWYLSMNNWCHKPSIPCQLTMCPRDSRLTEHHDATEEEMAGLLEEEGGSDADDIISRAKENLSGDLRDYLECGEKLLPTLCMVLSCCIVNTKCMEWVNKHKEELIAWTERKLERYSEQEEQEVARQAAATPVEELLEAVEDEENLSSLGSSWDRQSVRSMLGDTRPSRGRPADQSDKN